MIIIRYRNIELLTDKFLMKSKASRPDKIAENIIYK